MELIAKLITSLVLTACLVVAELAMGHFTHCLTLLVVTNQSIQNLITIATSTASEKLKGSPNKRWSFGYTRLPVIGLLGGQIFLISMCFATSVETLQTLFHIHHLDVMHNPSQVCLLAGVHFIVWIIIFLLIGGNTNHQIAILSRNNETERNHSPWHFITNCRISHLVRDLSCCFSLAIATGIIMILSLYSVKAEYIIYVDPCFALLTILVLLLSQCSFMKVLCKTILQAQVGDPPPFLQSKKKFEEYLCRKFPSILSVHEFHHWNLTPSKDVLTCHVIFKNMEEGSSDFKDLKIYLERNHTYVTLQPEFLSQEIEVSFTECHYQCVKACCNAKTCCPAKKESV